MKGLATRKGFAAIGGEADGSAGVPAPVKVVSVVTEVNPVTVIALIISCL